MVIDSPLFLSFLKIPFRSFVDSSLDKKISLQKEKWSAVRDSKGEDAVELTADEQKARKAAKVGMSPSVFED